MSLSSEWTAMVTRGGFKNRYFMVRHGQSEANVAQLVSSIFSVSVANHGLTPLGKSQALQAAEKFATVASVKPDSEDILGSRVALPVALQQQHSDQNGQVLLHSPTDLSNVIFYVSDFKRAYETGYYLKQGLETEYVQQLKALESKSATQKDPNVEKPLPLVPFYSHPSLRERFFGVFEGACPSDDIYEKVWRQDETNEPTSGHFNVESIQSVVSRTTELILEIEQIYSEKLIVLVSHGDVAQIVLALCAAIDPRFHRTLPHMNNCDVRELLFANGQKHLVAEEGAEGKTDNTTDVLVVQDDENQ